MATGPEPAAPSAAPAPPGKRDLPKPREWALGLFGAALLGHSVGNPEEPHGALLPGEEENPAPLEFAGASGEG